MSIDQASNAYATLQRLIENEAAIVLHDDKRSMVEMRLSPVAVENGFDNVAALIDAVSHDASPSLKDSVVESLTTHETSFFREPHLFEALRNEMLPRLEQERASRKKLRIWSAACSSGQEPYSIAILLLEYFPHLASEWNIEILASDISQRILARGMEGRYGKHEVNRGLQARMLLRYFEQDGDDWVVKPIVRQMVSWRRINLSEPLPPMGPFDIVLLRNVLIYFSASSKKRVLDQAGGVMAKHGYLSLGGAEMLMQIESDLRRESIGRSTVYRR